MLVSVNVTAGTTYMVQVAAQDATILVPGDSSVLNIKPTPAAGNFTVNTTADAVDTAIGDGICSASGVGCTLRAAINEANASQPGSTITLPAGLYTISKSIPDDPFNPGSRLSEDASINGDLDFISAVTITGAGPQSTIIDGGGASFDGALEFFSGANVTISGVTIRNGYRIAGGGVRLNNTAAVTLNNVWVTGNSAAFGGGVTVEGGTLNVSNSAITSNVATGGSEVSGNGGGIEVRDYAASDVEINLTNVTISGNAAVTPVVPWAAVCETPAVPPTEGYIFAAKGGGVYFGPTAGSILTTTFNNVTLAGNNAWCGGGIFTDTGVTVLTSNTLIGDNIATTYPDCRGNIGSQASNVISTVTVTDNVADCTVHPADIINQPVRLNPLYLNAPGSTPTHLLRAASPARDAGNAATCSSVDQRAIPRPQAAKCDIGALEVINVVPGAFSLLTPAHDLIVPSATALTQFTWQRSTDALSYVITLDEISTGTPVNAYTANVTAAAVCAPLSCTLNYTGSLPDGFYRYKVVAYVDTNATAAVNTHVVQVDSVSGLPNLLTNSGFEIKGLNKQALKWNAKGISGDKRMCNRDSNVYSYKENCAYRFKGTKLENSSIRQKLNLTGLVLEKDKSFRFSFYANYGASIKGTVMLKIVYKNKKIAPSKQKLVLPAGDQTWIPLTGSVVLKNARVTKAVMVFTHTAKTGIWYIDEVRAVYLDGTTTARQDASLTRDMQNDGLLPPPPAPDGFRGNN
jgi:CSLREA domain-containing protein